jgi:hypothetical protein
LIMMMVPGKYELERTWIHNNIIVPLLSWKAAKAAFIKHFQRGDYIDGRRLLYTQCNQASGESIQEYSRRFQTLATQLHYSDSDSQTIYHYIDGLHRHIQQKLVTYKITMRTVGGDPTYDFKSLITTINLAITIGTEPIYPQRPQTQSTLPVHLQHSALANPNLKTNNGGRDNSNTSRTKSADIHSDTATHTRDAGGNRKRSLPSSTEVKKCQYHPNSTTHSTEECRTKGGKSKESSTEPPPVNLTINQTQKSPTPLARIPSTPYPPATGTSSNPQCFRCNQFGHMARDCPQKPINNVKSTSSTPGTKPTNNFNSNSLRNGQPTIPPTKRARRAHVTFDMTPTEITNNPIPTQATGTPLKSE